MRAWAGRAPPAPFPWAAGAQQALSEAWSTGAWQGGGSRADLSKEAVGLGVSAEQAAASAGPVLTASRRPPGVQRRTCPVSAVAPPQAQSGGASPRVGSTGRGRPARGAAEAPGSQHSGDAAALLSPSRQTPAAGRRAQERRALRAVGRPYRAVLAGGEGAGMLPARRAALAHAPGRAVTDAPDSG